MNISKDVDLKAYNTFSIQAKAQHFAVLRTTDEIPDLLHSALFSEGKHLFLGGGSNVLFTGNYDGLVIKVDLKGITLLAEDDETVTLHAMAGETWHSFVMYCVGRGYGGIENLSLIPGTCGAAPMQNIGAYGVEIKDVILRVDAVDILTGKKKTFTNKECGFGYRESIFKQTAKDKFLITGITVRLTKKNHRLNKTYGAIEDTLANMGIKDATVKAISEAVIQIRRSKLPDPAIVGNAGSFFKNPTIPVSQYATLKEIHPDIPSYPAEEGQVKVPAGWLIERCGWKGKTFDSIGVHKNQALVIVNYGGGEGKKIWELAMNIQQSVKDSFNIILTPEVNVV